MKKVKILGKTITVPAPFRKVDSTETFKIKLPKKSKLAKSKITDQQFAELLEEEFNYSYNNGAFEVTDTARSIIRRRHVILKVTSTGDF